MLFQKQLAFFVLIASFLTTNGIELCNSVVCMNFNESTGLINSLVDRTTNIDVIGVAGGTVPLLSFSLVGVDGELRMDDLINSKSNVEKISGIRSKKLFLSWEDVKIFNVKNNTSSIAKVLLTLSISLRDQSTIFELDYSFTIKEGSKSVIAIWDIAVSVPVGISSDEKGGLCEDLIC